MPQHNHRVCACGQGYASAYDGKCGHCRTRREQKTHWHKLRHGLYPKENENG